jgi:hypothetical protein
MLAPASDIRSAIRAYYGDGSADGEQDAGDSDAPPPSIAPAAAPAAVAAPAPAPAPAPEPEVTVEISGTPIARAPSQPPALAPESLPPSDSPTIEAREVSMPAPPRRKGRRMVTLTLLDGTRVNLPARTSRPPAAGPGAAKVPEDGSGQLTARDLVAALRAVSHGADASEILGDKARWEPLFAALLELLLKKHLIADWEFVAEYKKI